MTLEDHDELIAALDGYAEAISDDGFSPLNAARHKAQQACKKFGLMWVDEYIFFSLLRYEMEMGRKMMLEEAVE